LLHSQVIHRREIARPRYAECRNFVILDSTGFRQQYTYDEAVGGLITLPTTTGSTVFAVGKFEQPIRVSSTLGFFINAAALSGGLSAADVAAGNFNAVGCDPGLLSADFDLSTLTYADMSSKPTSSSGNGVGGRSFSMPSGATQATATYTASAGINQGCSATASAGGAATIYGMFAKYTEHFLVNSINLDYGKAPWIMTLLYKV